MRHVILTCKNHPNLRWSVKEIAITDGKYNGARNIYFMGSPTGKGMYSDMSGLDCAITRVVDGKLERIDECSCKADCLVVAPEDEFVKRE